MKSKGGQLQVRQYTYHFYVQSTLKDISDGAGLIRGRITGGSVVYVFIYFDSINKKKVCRVHDNEIKMTYTLMRSNQILCLVTLNCTQRFRVPDNLHVNNTSVKC